VKRATGLLALPLSPASRAEFSVVYLSWGLHPRLYACCPLSRAPPGYLLAARFAGAQAICLLPASRAPRLFACCPLSRAPQAICLLPAFAGAPGYLLAARFPGDPGYMLAARFRGRPRLFACCPLSRAICLLPASGTKEPKQSFRNSACWRLIRELYECQQGAACAQPASSTSLVRSNRVTASTIPEAIAAVRRSHSGAGQ
jgi:hypothetical protein